MIVLACPLRSFPCSMFDSIGFEKGKSLFLGFIDGPPERRARPCNQLEEGFQMIRLTRLLPSTIFRTKLFV